MGRARANGGEKLKDDTSVKGMPMMLLGFVALALGLVFFLQISRRLVNNAPTNLRATFFHL